MSGYSDSSNSGSDSGSSESRTAYSYDDNYPKDGYDEFAPETPHASSVLAKAMDQPKFRILNAGGPAALQEAIKQAQYTKGSKGDPTTAAMDLMRGMAAKRKAILTGEHTALMDNNDPSYDAVVKHFMAGADAGTSIASVLSIVHPETRAEFNKYTEKLGKKRSFLAKNNLLLTRAYHGTTVQCTIGLDGNITPCVNKECNLCQIIRNGFTLKRFGTGERQHPDLAESNYAPRFGKGLYFSLNSAAAQEYSTCAPTEMGKHGRTAVLACLVASGNEKSLWEGDATLKKAPDGFDSVLGRPMDAQHPESKLRSPELCIYDARAVIATQVIVYSHTHRLCPNCGLQVDLADKAPTRTDTQNGTYCSEVCRQEYVKELEDAENSIKITPRLKDPSWNPIWTRTDSEENCVLIDLYRGSQEYSIIVGMCRKTLPNIEMEKIFRVQNVFLWEKYYAEKMRVEKKNGGRANEILAFHGTSSAEPSDIYDTEEGFDLRFSNWGMWGRGTYFAANASYSHNYSFAEPTGFNSMFVAKVILGDSHEMPPDSSLTMPPIKPVTGGPNAPVLADKGSPGSTAGGAGSKGSKGKGSGKGSGKSSAKDIKFKKTLYDSVCGYTGGSKVFIVYSAPKAYPAYLITYKLPNRWDD